MQYIRFTQVDALTKVSINVAHSKEGPTWPEIKGLSVLFQDKINTVFWYGTVDDDAVDDPSNQCWIIDQATLAMHVKRNIDRLIVTFKENLYNEEKQVRVNVLGKYDATASLAGIYKYDQALAILSDNLAPAPEIRAEATAREMDPILMAERIKTNHETFRTTEAKISGIRGKLLDRLNAFVFDDADPLSSWDDFHKPEIIAQITEMNQETETEETVDITADYYGTDIGIRLRFSV